MGNVVDVPQKLSDNKRHRDLPWEWCVMASVENLIRDNTTDSILGLFGPCEVGER